jgi:hypothetical protein
MSATPPLGWVRVYSVDPPISFVVRLGADRPNIDQGFGGWQEVARPRRSTLSIWQGQPALRMTLSIQFDEWVTQTSVEREIAQLERLASPSASDAQPARVKLVARGSAVPYQARQWVIDNLIWGDAAINAKGDRVRQQVSLSLLEYIADVRVDQVAPSQRQRTKSTLMQTKPGASQKRVVAGKSRSSSSSTAPASMLASTDPVAGFAGGDDLLSIAARELGDASRWVEIAQLNGIRDPRTVVVGQVIKLP